MLNKVHLIDCNDFMAAKPDNYYDLAIVDPPYGIGVNQMNMGSRKTILPDEKIWDKQIPDDKYFNELFRISINQIIWGGNYFSLGATRGFVIWDKGETMYGRSFVECEFAWNSIDCSARLIKLNPNQLDRIHPTQKPIALYKWLLKNYAKPGQTIVDTHVGSGSSRIACHDLGFDFEGCEIDKDYWQAQEDRYDNYIQQIDLFVKNEIQDLIYNTGK